MWAQIVGNIGCSQALVRKWRKRWCQTRSLEEAPRPGRPRMFEAIVRAKVTAIALRVAAGIACSKPTCKGLSKSDCPEGSAKGERENLSRLKLIPPTPI